MFFPLVVRSAGPMPDRFGPVQSLTAAMSRMSSAPSFHTKKSLRKFDSSARQRHARAGRCAAAAGRSDGWTTLCPSPPLVDGDVKPARPPPPPPPAARQVRGQRWPGRPGSLELTASGGGVRTARAASVATGSWPASGTARRLAVGVRCGHYTRRAGPGRRAGRPPSTGGAASLRAVSDLSAVTSLTIVT